MKQFNAQKFRDDLVALRGADSQSVFANRVGVKRSTLSLLETGKQLPTFDIFVRVCDMLGKTTDEYFTDTQTDSLVYLMGSLEEADKEKIEEMSERIRIKEKYELLALRGKNVIN